MRILITLTAVLGLTVASAQAQMGGGRRHSNENGQKADNTPKIDEKAYKAALERIPDSKDKYDPWSGARVNEPAKKPK